MSSEVITWKNWTASYTPAEKKLMPKNVREAEFIHELKARFDGTLSEGGTGSAGKPVEQGLPATVPAEASSASVPPSESVLFPIPERVRVLLELMEAEA